MFTNQKIAFIGAGAMAGAIIGGLLKQGLVAATQITVSEPRADRRAELEDTLGINTVAGNATAAADADIVVLAVKPQIAPLALPELKGHLKPEAFLISIMAGMTIETIAGLTGHATVVRSMPNTPAQVGMGMTAWTASAGLSETQRAQTEAILGALGEQLEVAGEHYIDMATAINGSGPAYVFLFIEAFIDAGVRMGLPRPQAELLAKQTVRGAAEYASQSETTVSTLRHQVTSPGGTTAAAVAELEANGLRTALDKAVFAAFNQAQALGKK